MLQKSKFIPLLIVCALFSANFAVLSAAAHSLLVPSSLHDPHESTLPSAEMDFDVDIDHCVEGFCLTAPLPPSKGQGALIAALVTSVSHDRIYALQNLRI